MGSTASRTDTNLWEMVKRRITQGSRGGRAGQWSARKAQLATREYRRERGGYVGPKADDNSLTQWTKQDWGTRSGRRSVDSSERYLPKKARQALSKAEYDRTTAKKRGDTEAGHQFSGQPKDVARKAARYRRSGNSEVTRVELMLEARRRGLRGRSRMTKQELAHALSR